MRNRLIASALLVALLFTAPVAAADKRPPLAGQQARIVFQDGHTIEGKIASETRDTVRVGDRVIDLTDVATIDLANGTGKSHGAKNGFVIGALTGFALGAVYTPIASEWSLEAHYNPNGPAVGHGTASGVVSIVSIALVFGGIGAVIGYANGNDRPHYAKRIVVAGTSVDVAPAATLHSLGVSGRVIW